jgi:hypothetical protein
VQFNDIFRAGLLMQHVYVLRGDPMRKAFLFQPCKRKMSLVRFCIEDLGRQWTKPRIEPARIGAERT